MIALSIPRVCLDELEARRGEAAELARLDERLERLSSLPPAERELETDRLAHDASVIGVTFEQIASELGLASASEAEAAAQRHRQRSA